MRTNPLTSPGGKSIPAGTKRPLYERLAFYPYEAWICRDGRAVLANHFLEPIWYRGVADDGGFITDLADPTEACDVALRHQVYRDSDTEQQKRAKGAKEMASWGFVSATIPLSSGVIAVSGPFDYRVAKWHTAHRTCVTEIGSSLDFPWRRHCLTVATRRELVAES